MRRFLCECQNPLFFENVSCLTCGAIVGFDPVGRNLLALEPTTSDLLACKGSKKAFRWRLCANRDTCGCNWLVAEDEPSPLCQSCATTRTIPNLAESGSQDDWRATESSKRRLLYTLLNLGLWGRDSQIKPTLPLVFDFMSNLPGGPAITTGHENGVITLNLSEADGVQREQMRSNLNEPYRTLLGHLRHESGHYYWEVLIPNSRNLTECRQLFGDETQDYQAAMADYYAAGPPSGWRDRHISAYATMHPWEDWAETWAHYLHLTDTLETAEAVGNLSGFSRGTTQPALDPTPFVGIAGATPEDAAAFADKTHRWCDVVVLANELSRSMGQPDVYPFSQSLPVLQKLFFIDRVISGQATAKANPQPKAT
jgi:hypothetical protein